MVLSDSDFESGMFPKIANKYIGVVAVEGFPNSSEFCILNALSELDFEYRYSSRYIVFDRLKSNLHLEKYRRFWAQKKRGLFSMFSESPVTQNADAVEQEQNVSDAKTERNKNAKIFGTYTGCIIIYDRKLYELKRKAKQAAKLILSLGFGARIESVNATDAYLGSLPGHCTENVRRALISNEVFADFLPLNTSFKGEKYSPNTKFFGDRAPVLQRTRRIHVLNGEDDIIAVKLPFAACAIAVKREHALPAGAQLNIVFALGVDLGDIHIFAEYLNRRADILS